MCLTNRPGINGGGLPKSKLKLFILLCFIFGCYVLLIQNSSFLNEFHWNYLLASNLKATIIHGHRVGTKNVQIRQNGTSTVYFHLPSLDDYKIQDDYFQFNKTITDKLTSSQSSARSCLRRGSQVIQSNLIGLQSCICNPNYFGQDCSVPKIVQDALLQDSELKIDTLNRPRRLLMSLIWLSFHQHQNNTLYQINLENLYKTLDEFLPLIDMFIIHEIIFEPSISNFSLQTQFDHGLFSKFKSFTLLNAIKFNEYGKSSENFRHIEWESMRQSWRIFSTQVTEYRPSDILIFMSINQFPTTDLILFLKYHTGIQDIVHIGPIYNFYYQNKSLIMFDHQNSLSTESIKTNNPVNSMLDRIKNVIISFQYMASLCQFSFEHYITNYCQMNQDLIKHFRANFWPIHHIRIGSKVQSVATKVIL
ncbi:beta-1 [Dermatophagoides farinae]|uniref:Beta-1 n=1 Tax=Dermatophagoides farinae TaxID=6954 RepID=A0A9D4NQK4_DERFA|nr:uncharacterized protein LOC124494650 [Dermatophagoides farinae]KAH7636988.1 beta-1 [Dermatophagoides farinae]